jgi:hypothetical protein
VAVCALAATAIVQAQTTVSIPDNRVVRYEMKLSDLKYVYGVASPVMHLRSGDTLETTTADADGHTLIDAGMKVMGPNPLTGPFYIDGAEPGDTLAIHFERVEVNAPVGYVYGVAGFWRAELEPLHANAGRRHSEARVAVCDRQGSEHGDLPRGRLAL